MEPRDPFDLCGVTIDGKYRVASVVGDGGFGVVYRGVHKGFGELIAIKCLKLPASLDQPAQAELLEKLQDEGRLLHRLSKATSGIVQALDVGAFTTQAGTWVPYLVMEWLDGETLAEHLKQRSLDTHGSLGGGMSLAEAVALLEPAAKALAVAHAQKIAHRDVKPANIFVTKVGDSRTTKILDFGIAKVLSDHRGYTTALESTNMAPTAFTPRYGAPEQFNKQRGATGPWTDVFALALVLVECVTGRKALEGDDPTQLYIASADPALRPTLRSRGIEVPDGVEEVLRKALEVEPKNRYADAGVFWSALDKALVAAGIEATTSVPKPSSKSRGTSGLDLSSSEPMLETSEFAAKRQLRVDGATEGASARSAFGPTMPVESLKPTKKGKPSTSRPSDPMEETPEGERRSATAKASATAPQASKGSFVWTGLAVAIFAGGGVFAYTTLVKPPAPVGSASASVSVAPSASASAKKLATAKASASASASVSASASAFPSASASPTVSASASPSADAGPDAPPDPAREGMVLIEAGNVKLADPGDVAVAAFYLDSNEVTVRRYLKCQRAKGCTAADHPLEVDADEATKWSSRCNATRKGAADHPINCVTFAQASEFCKWDGKRLPSEAEWELAARGTGGHSYVWGEAEPACNKACFDKNEGCLDPTKEIASCAVGVFNDDRTERDVFDMAGNVSEWVTAGERVTRGGNFWLGKDAVRATFRAARATGFAHPTVGFRCAADGK